MSTPLQSLIASGTKLWLDSIDPDLVRENRRLGATGATSNPLIIAGLMQTGRFDDQLQQCLRQGLDDEQIAWKLTDELVQGAQQVFFDVWQSTQGNDGYVSFELDPLIEDTSRAMPHAARVERYIELGKHWAADQPNRMIKVPATPAGMDALTPLAAAGVTLNVTLVFTARQYRAARDAVWRGAQQRRDLAAFKSVYSIFVSRVDVYTAKHVPQLPAHAQGWVGIVNAKRIWAENQAFWREHPTPLQQEIIFASTGTKDPQSAPWKYVQAFAGSDIQTNPPETNDAVQHSGQRFSKQIDKFPEADIQNDIDRQIDRVRLEQVLLEEGVRKFAEPQLALLQRMAEKRRTLPAAS